MGRAPDSAVLAPQSASPQYIIESIIEAAGVGPNDNFYDLGCGGTGRIVIGIAASTGAQAVGMELDADAAASAQKAVVAAGVKGVAILQGDVMTAQLQSATVIFMYLLPQGLSMLSKKLQCEVTQNCRILSYMFKIPGWDRYLVRTVPVTSGRPDKLDVSAVSRLYMYSYNPPEAAASSLATA